MFTAKENGTRLGELSGKKRAATIITLASLPVGGWAAVAFHASSGGRPDTGVATASASATGHGPSADRSPMPGHSPTEGASRPSSMPVPEYTPGMTTYTVDNSCPPGKSVSKLRTLPWDGQKIFAIEDNVGGANRVALVNPHTEQIYSPGFSEGSKWEDLFSRGAMLSLHAEKDGVHRTLTCGPLSYQLHQLAHE
jgi:hypothetical protein